MTDPSSAQKTAQTAKSPQTPNSSQAQPMRSIPWPRVGKKIFWIVLMFGMIGVFAVLYDVNYTRPYIHEILGSIIIIILAFHVTRNRHFFSLVGRKNFPQTRPSDPVIPRYSNPVFILSDAINIFLIVSCVVCLITGILISKFVFKDIVAALFAIENTRTIRPYHAISCYLLLMAIGLHAGLQLNTLFSFLTHALNKTWTRIVQGSLVIMGLHGLYCIFAYNFLSKFELRASKSIGTLHPEWPQVLYWCEIGCVAVFFALISYALSTYLTYRHMRD